jgi:hypothetical protein
MTAEESGVSHLSEALREAIAASFPPGDRAAAEKLIAEECTEESLHWKGVEQARAAIVTVSEGSLERLLTAIARARIDARDVIAEAQQMGQRPPPGRR